MRAGHPPPRLRAQQGRRVQPAEENANVVQAPPAAGDEGLLPAQPQPRRQGPQRTGAEDRPHEARSPGRRRPGR